MDADLKMQTLSFSKDRTMSFAVVFKDTLSKNPSLIMYGELSLRISFECCYSVEIIANVCLPLFSASAVTPFVNVIKPGLIAHWIM
jgi:hypothetical protein